MTPSSRIQWLSDLIRVEIALWNRIDAQLRQEHSLSMAFFETLYFIGCSPEGTLRVGDLARAVGITVGAASKLVDRVEGAGLIRREADAEDRRASRVVLTDAGRQALGEAGATYTAEVAAALDPAISADEQQQMHSFVKRLLATVNNGGAG